MYGSDLTGGSLGSMPLFFPSEAMAVAAITALRYVSIGMCGGGAISADR